MDPLVALREDRADAAFLVEEVPWEEASRYGVCDTNKYGEIVEVVEKPDDPPSNLVMTGFYTFTPAIFHACHLVQPSNRGEYELSDAIDLLIHSGRTIDAIRMDGWRVDVGYPEDRDEAERRLQADETVLTTQAEAMARASGPVLAYCASGNRCAIVWSLIEAPRLGADAVLAATRAAGYDHSMLRPQLEAVAGR